MSATAPELEQMYDCPSGCKPAEDDRGKCPLLISAYILSGLAMMLNIRLSYSSAPYALIRFRLPENLFSVFVRRMASSLELWCLPGFVIADGIELAVKLLIKEVYKDNTLKSKQLKYGAIIVPSILAQWLNFLTYVILFFVYLAGDDQGRLTTFYWTIAVSGFVFGINNVFVFAADYNYIPIYIAGENCFPALTSFIHYLTTLIFGNRRKWDSDFLIVFIDIFVAIIISLVAAVVWTIAYGFCRDAAPDGNITHTTPEDIKRIIVTYTVNGITTNSETNKTTTLINGKVTIKTGTGPEDATETVPAKDITGTAEITSHKDGTQITLKVTNITGDLADLKNTGGPCNVTYKDAQKQLTIKYKDTADKYIEITLTSNDISTLAALGTPGPAKTTGNANIKVDPPPNQLTIKYSTTNGSVTKTATINTNAAQTIVQEIKNTDEDPAGTKTTYYKVIHPETKIRYTFKLKNNQANKPIKNAPAKIIVDYGHIFAEGFSDITDIKASMISPLLIVLVGMGLVYAIYPGIAPGMIVPFYLIDKIEMVLLIATIFPPVIIALLQKDHPNWSPKTKVLGHKQWKFPGWTEYNDDKFRNGKFEQGETIVYAQLWHFFDILMILMIILAAIFIYSLHYRDSNISRSIVNQPKMSTALTIIFYMCHEISLAVGFAGMVANAAEYTVIAQLIGAFLMVFLALYSEGYIIEYKSHDPAHWPTEGMTKWNAFCYWCKRASKITNHNLRSLFTTDLRRDLLLCIQKNELI